MNFENITYEVEDGIAIITINRPEALNALNSKTLDELCSAAFMAGEDPEVGAVILTGAGDKAFVAGADIKEMIEFTPMDMKEFCLRGQASLATLEELKKPVICAINGFALGGGLELALACDVRIASENAKLGLPEVSLGIIPGFGGTQRLPRLVGPGRAKEMVMSAGMYDAQKAEAWGLVNSVHPPDELMDAAKKIADKFTGLDIENDNDLGDAIGKLTNILAGRTQLMLDNQGLKTDLTLPSVYSVQNLRVLIQRKNTHDYFHFDSPLGKLWVGVTVGISPGLIL